MYQNQPKLAKISKNRQKRHKRQNRQNEPKSPKPEKNWNRQNRLKTLKNRRKSINIVIHNHECLEYIFPTKILYSNYYYKYSNIRNWKKINLFIQKWIDYNSMRSNHGGWKKEWNHPQYLFHHHISGIKYMCLHDEAPLVESGLMTIIGPWVPSTISTLVPLKIFRTQQSNSLRKR